MPPVSIRKTYSRKPSNVFKRRDSCDAINALFAVNLQKREISFITTTRNIKRKSKKIQIKELPAKDRFHHLIEDSVVRSCPFDDTFDKMLKSGQVSLKDGSQNASKMQGKYESSLDKSVTNSLIIERECKKKVDEFTLSSFSSQSNSNVLRDGVVDNCSIEKSYDKKFEEVQNRYIIASTPAAYCSPKKITIVGEAISPIAACKSRHKSIVDKSYELIHTWNFEPPSEFQTVSLLSSSRSSTPKRQQWRHISKVKNRVKHYRKIPLAYGQLKELSKHIRETDEKLNQEPKVALTPLFLNTLGITDSVQLPSKTEESYLQNLNESTKSSSASISNPLSKGRNDSELPAGNSSPRTPVRVLNLRKRAVPITGRRPKLVEKREVMMNNETAPKLLNDTVSRSQLKNCDANSCNEQNGTDSNGSSKSTSVSNWISQVENGTESSAPSVSNCSPCTPVRFLNLRKRAVPITGRRRKLVEKHEIPTDNQSPAKLPTDSSTCLMENYHASSSDEQNATKENTSISQWGDNISESSDTSHHEMEIINQIINTPAINSDDDKDDLLNSAGEERDSMYNRKLCSIYSKSLPSIHCHALSMREETRCLNEKSRHTLDATSNLTNTVELSLSATEFEIRKAHYVRKLNFYLNSTSGSNCDLSKPNLVESDSANISMDWNGSRSDKVQNSKISLRDEPTIFETESVQANATNITPACNDQNISIVSVDNVVFNEKTDSDNDNEIPLTHYEKLDHSYCSTEYANVSKNGQNFNEVLNYSCNNANSICSSDVISISDEEIIGIQSSAESDVSHASEDFNMSNCSISDVREINKFTSFDNENYVIDKQDLGHEESFVKTDDESNLLTDEEINEVGEDTYASTDSENCLIKEDTDKVNELSSCVPLKKSVLLKEGKAWRRSLLQHRKLSILRTTQDCTNSPIISEPSKLFRRSILSTIRQSINSSLFESSQLNTTIETAYGPDSTTETLYQEESIGESLHLTRNKSIYEETPYERARNLVLRKCGQEKPLPFEECYPSTILQRCRKIGEGVYGEVFLYKNSDGFGTVMKIIPIEGSQLVNDEPQKKFHEILSEIVIAM
ncbi:uncharacterized protein LOC116169994 isoform X2 [Photinus pyralis]|uniref:uncharacterized protein LOC116169994 isoform X2 n=1 Tax=Photinus pyralis TaxID=7054 RepID=UPI0012677869|nr:uncharacterized protein LOC116169994 isoform X2 [Photinus pyralis]